MKDGSAGWPKGTRLQQVELDDRHKRELVHRTLAESCMARFPAVLTFTHSDTALTLERKACYDRDWEIQGVVRLDLPDSTFAMDARVFAQPASVVLALLKRKA